jgi:hypothetical protein
MLCVAAEASREAIAAAMKVFNSTDFRIKCDKSRFKIQPFGHSNTPGTVLYRILSLVIGLLPLGYARFEKNAPQDG